METLYTVEQAATYLTVHPETLKKWVREKKGPTAVRLSPRKIVFREVALKEFLDRKEEV